MISKLIEDFKNKTEYLTILLIWVFYGLNNYIWLKKNQSIYYADEAWHLNAALEILDTSKNILQMISKLLYFSINNFYPPFFHTVMAGFNMILGRSHVYSILANLVFMLIMILSVYNAGAKISGKKAGFLSVFILLSYPFIFALSRSPLPDFAMSAMVSLSLCCLIYCEHFSKTAYSVLFGLSFGFGMLTKQLYILFIMPAVLFLIIHFIIQKYPLNKNIITNLAITFLIIISISGPWYTINLKVLIPNYFNAAYFYNPVDNYPIFSFKSLMYNYVNLINNQMLMFYFEIFIIGLVGWLMYLNDINRKYLLLFSSSIAGIYLIFILIQTKELKTTAPYLVYFALISGIGISLLKSTAIRNIIIFLTICFGITEYYILSYNNTFDGKKVMGINIDKLLLNYSYPASPWGTYYPVKNNSKMGSIIELISKDKIWDKPPIIGTFNTFYGGKNAKLNSYYKYDCSLIYYFRLNKVPGEFINIANLGIRSKLDYIILCSDINMLVPYDKGIKDKYRLMGDIKMEDSSHIFVYKINKK
ncbi:MAG: glycosyltransferase family 39 protein [Elusimicrobia bacterium]|nr:glycosyltransferase family 39 protein [Candidatus Liberimonas magnetica]